MRPKPAALLGDSPAFAQMQIAPGELANTCDVFGPLIEERLWPNDRYSWLSGIFQYTPIRVTPPSQGGQFHTPPPTRR